MKTVKVAICIPVYGMTHAKFTHSLTNMVIYTLSHANLQIDGEPAQIEFDTYMVSCSMLTESRHRLMAEALKWGADYALCLDADHVFPPDTLMRLLSHGAPIVGCNYPRRCLPTAPTAATDSTDMDGHHHLLYTTQEKADKKLLEPCSHLGFGVLLIDMRVFDALQHWAEANEPDGNFLPLFKFEPTADKIGMIGEDVFFFRKLALAGITPFVDHGLSWEVGHCADVVMTNADAYRHRDAWKAKQKAKRKEFDDAIEKIEQEAA